MQRFVSALAVAVIGITGIFARGAPAQVVASGIAGLRINHNSSVHVENFGVK
jgi:hypothetical protein